MKYRIDLAIGPSDATAPEGITLSPSEDKTSSTAESDDLTAAKELAITQYGHYTAQGLPVHGAYVVDTDTGDTRNPMKVVAEMTAAGFKDEPAE